MLLAASYEIIPLDRGLSVGQGAVGVGVSIGRRQYSQHSLKVTHLLSLVETLTQQCFPSGLKCVGPRSRATASGAPVKIKSLPVATTPVVRSRVTEPPLGGPCHTTPARFEV